MDSSFKISGVRTELEYLAALLALREGVLDSVELSEAVTALVEGNASSMLEALRSRSSLSDEQLQDGLEQARVCTELLAAKARLAEMKRRGSPAPAAVPIQRPEDDLQRPAGLIERPRSQPPPPPLDDDDGDDSTALLAPMAAASGPTRWQQVPWVDTDELDPTANFVTEMPEEDFEWRPTSELLSHFYLIEDTIRSFTGGLLGITSAMGLLICLGLASWGVVRSGVLEQFFVTPEPTVAAAEPQIAEPRIQPREITLPIARLDPLEDIEADGEEGGEERMDGEPALAPELPELDSEAGAEISSTVEIVQAENASRNDEAGVEAAAEEVERSATWRIDTMIDIEKQMTLVNQDLGRLDLNFAMSRLEELAPKRRPTLELSLDERWLLLGAALLTHSNSDSSLGEAVEWLGPLFESDNPLARLVLARWLFAAQPHQMDALREYVMSRGGEPSSDMINWLFAARGNRPEHGLDDTIDALKARLQEPAADPLNHLFLSLASYNQGNRVAALNALREFSSYLKQKSYWQDSEQNAESRWTRESAVSALNTYGIALKKKLDLATSPR